MERSIGLCTRNYRNKSIIVIPDFLPWATPYLG